MRDGREANRFVDNDDDDDVGVDDDDDDDDADVDDCLFRGRHDLPEEKPVIGCNAPHDEYPLSDYDFHRNTHHGDDDDDSGDSDDDDDVCQSNIYRECVSSLPRRRHQTACGYTLELSNIIISIVITIIRNYDNLIIIIIIMIIRRPVLQNHLLTDWFVRI